MHGLEQVARGAHAHQISRPILRQQFGHRGSTVLSLSAAFTDREAADGVAVEGQFRDDTGAFDAQIRIARPLYDTEQSLTGIAACRQAAHRPAVGQFHRVARHTVLDCGGDALIEYHHDVRADRLLRVDAAFRTQANQGIVHVTREFGAFLAHGAISG